MYVSTTLHGDWLERVVAHGLGGRGEAVATVTGDGILLARTGEPDLFVPVGALREVRREAGQVGKFVEEGGLVVLTWEHGGRLLDTAFRTRRAEARPLLTAAATALLGSTTPHPPTGTEDGPTAGPITTPGTTSHTTTLAAAGTTGARKEQQ
jgi:hypothetical protein